MKTLEEKACEYAENAYIVFPQSAVKSAFIAGDKAAQEWISVDDELPEKEMWIIAKSEYPETLPFYKSMFYVLGNKEQLKINFTHWRPINND